MGQNLEANRHHFRNPSQCSDGEVTQAIAEAAALGYSNGARERLRMLIGVARARCIEEDNIRDAIDQGRERYRGQIIQRMAELEAMPERRPRQEERLGELNRKCSPQMRLEVKRRAKQEAYDNLKRQLAVGGGILGSLSPTVTALVAQLEDDALVEEARAEVQAQLRGEAVPLLLRGNVQGRDAERLAYIQGMLTASQWGEATAEADRQKETKAAQERAKAERLARRPKLALADPAAVTMYQLQQKLRTINWDVPLRRMGGVYGDLASQLSNSYYSDYPGPTLSRLCAGRGIVVRQFVADLNRSEDAPFLIEEAPAPGAWKPGAKEEAATERADTRKVARIAANATIEDLHVAANRETGWDLYGICDRAEDCASGNHARVWDRLPQVEDRRTPVETVCRQFGVTLPSLLAELNKPAHKFPIRIECGAQVAGGGAAERVGEKVIDLDLQSATVGRLREALQNAGTDMQTVCAKIAETAHWPMTIIISELPKDSLSGRKTLRVLCGECRITLGELLAAINESGCGVHIGVGAATDTAERRVAKRRLELPSAESCQCGDIWKALQRMGSSWQDFCEALRKKGGVYHALGAQLLGAISESTSFDGVCRESSRKNASAIASDLNDDPTFPFQFAFESAGREEGAGRDGDVEEEQKPKRRIVLPSKLAGVKQLRDAFGGEEGYAAFMRALEERDMGDSYTLSCALWAAAQKEGGESKPLEEYGPLIRQLNRDPQFPYSIEFVYHEDDARAHMRMTPEQLWYERGANDRLDRDSDWDPPSREYGDAAVRAYTEGFQDRNRVAYFPVEEGEEDSEVRAAIPTFSLLRSATVKDLIQAFPGGMGALRQRLQSAPSPSMAISVDRICDPSRRNESVRMAFPPGHFSDDWLRKHLGLTFRDGQE